MKNMFRTILVALVLVIAISGVALAIPYTDVYDAGPDGIIGLHMDNYGILGCKSVAWTFDITDDGFNPITQDVTAADIVLHFSEYDPDCWGTWFDESARLSIGENVFNWEVDTGNVTFVINSLMTLSDSGTVFCRLTATDGDFWFNQATLNADGTAPVPEPATLLLLGSGLLGLAGFRKKIK